MKYFIFIFFIVIGFFIYFWYKKKPSFESKIVDAFIENIEEIVLTDEEYFQLGQIYHYGKFSKPQNKELALENYKNCIKIASTDLNVSRIRDSSHNELIALSHMNIARLYQEQEIINIDNVINHYLHALESGMEEAILEIGKIYLHGIHPSYLPDKMIAGRIFSTFINISETIKPWCKLYLQEIHSIHYSDLDSIKQKDVIYKPLPSNIVNLIQFSLNQRKIHIPYKVKFETNWLKQDEEDDVRQMFVKLPRQVVVNDTQNVHDHSLQNIGNEILNTLQSNDDFETNLKDLNKSYDKKNYPNIERVTNSLSSLNHSRFDRSEQDVFNSVWTKVKDNNETKQIFLDNLNSAVEYDTVVCSTGKIMRMLSTFDGVDDSVPDLKADWVIKDEISQTIANVINKLSESEKKQYESHHNEHIKNVIKQRVKSKCRKDYKNVVDDAILETYTDNLLEFI